MALTVDALEHPPDAEIVVPGSKSITNRALLAAALASGTSRLTGLLDSADTRAMIGAVRALGASVELEADATVATVTGVAGVPAPGPVEVFVDQSGTVSRFVTPAVALGRGTYTVDGHHQMRARPMADLFEALGSLGVHLEPGGERGRLPVAVEATGLAGGSVRLPGHVSSQFVSGLLLAAPCASGELEIELTTAPVSVPYLQMTVAVQEAFGATVEVSPDWRHFSVRPGGYRCTVYAVEPDASSASYFFAAAAMSGGRVRVPGLHRASLQGDVAFVEVLEAMGAEVRWEADAIEVRGGAPLSGGRFDLSDFSDTVPTLAVVAAAAEGTTHIDGVGFIRAKESDRIGATVTELGRCGVPADELDDGILVHGDPDRPVPAEPTLVHCYDDHRIAMAFTVLGLRTGAVMLDQPECVAKTFPGFFDVVEQLRDPGHGVTVVAIDGPAGSGKSTIGRALAGRMGLDYLDTGAMFRAVAHAALVHGVDPSDTAAVAELARRSTIEVGDDTVSVDGSDATAAVRSPEVTAVVSAVAANPFVREQLRDAQRAWARARGGGVIEGRDIGTVVFPSALLKIYLTASPTERARRRAEQAGLDERAVLSDIERRDGADSSRRHAPLAEATDAVVVDTTGLAVDEVVSRLVTMVEEARRR